MNSAQCVTICSAALSHETGTIYVQVPRTTRTPAWSEPVHYAYVAIKKSISAKFVHYEVWLWSGRTFARDRNHLQAPGTIRTPAQLDPVHYTYVEIKKTISTKFVRIYTDGNGVLHMTPGAVLDPMYCQWGTYTMLCRTLIRKLTIFLCGYSIVLNAQLAPSLVLMDSAGFGEFYSHNHSYIYIYIY